MNEEKKDVLVNRQREENTDMTNMNYVHSYLSLLSFIEIGEREETRKFKLEPIEHGRTRGQRL